MLSDFITYVESQITQTVWGEKVPVKSVRPSVLLRHAGGPSTPCRFIEQFRIDAFCYGATADGAFSVYEDLKNAMHNLDRETVSNTLLHSAQLAAGPSYTKDPDMNWDTYFSSWIITASTIEGG